MARDAEGLKIRLWAETGDRQNPEQVGLTRSRGWPVSYEQLGSGDEPERTIFNQLLREISGGILDRSRQGIYQWDSEVTYTHETFVTGSDGKIYVSLTDSGPAFGNSADPILDSSRNILNW